jgi:hypothetical protein
MLNYDDWFNSMSILYIAELVVVVVYERWTHAYLVLQRKRFHAKILPKNKHRTKERGNRKQIWKGGGLEVQKVDMGGGN